MLTLSADDSHEAHVMEMIRTRPEVEMGKLQDRWLPLVTDTIDPRGSREVHAWLESLPGVVAVDVILAGLDDNPS